MSHRPCPSLNVQDDKARCVVCCMVRDVETARVDAAFAIVTAFVVGHMGGLPKVCREHADTYVRAWGVGP
jgi:hypothetical protein